MIISETRTLLVEIEFQLKAAELWAVHKPSAQALLSKMPFACDVMPFENWLQFIFLPKMRDLIDSQNELPNSIALTPMAEHVWSEHPRVTTLIFTIQRLDTLLNAPR